MQQRPIITLTNGRRVMNFSSPHNFTFTDGTILPAVSNEESERLKILFIETPVKGGLRGDTHLNFSLTDAVEEAILRFHHLVEDDLVDVIYCPLPMIKAIRKIYGDDYLVKSRFRAVRIEDRIKKLVSVEKQTL